MSTAPATSVPAPVDLKAGRTVRLITPERVPLTLPLAGLGERAIALLVDALLLLLLLIALTFTYTFVGHGDLQRDFAASSSTIWVVLLLAFFATVVLYDVGFDLLGAGQTPGKRLTSIRVVDSTGRTPDLLTSLLRNLVRLVDMLPGGYGVGIVVMFFTGTRRLGDLVAGTVVVSERGRMRHPFDVVDELAPLLPEDDRLPPPWSDAHVQSAIDVLVGTVGLDATTAELLCSRVLQRLPVAASIASTSSRERLALGLQLLARTGQGLAARMLRLRLAERQLARAIAVLDAPKADLVEIVDGAVRHASSELLSATRRGVPDRALATISLALLDVERRRRPPSGPLGLRLRRYLGVEVPAAVWGERTVIARVAAIMASAFVVGFVLAWADADVARFLVGDDLATYIEHGAAWTNDIERNGEFALASMRIIANNIGVGLRVFALGVLGGVASVLGVLSNGLSFGSVFGYAARLGTEQTLLRFVLAHGPVELSMICVAGAAGLCLGRAIISPGSMRRVDALRLAGARGARLITFATIGFLVIGTVEGFVSPGAHFPIAVNISVGVAMWLAFFFWARLGARSVNPSG